MKISIGKIYFHCIFEAVQIICHFNFLILPTLKQTVFLPSINAMINIDFKKDILPHLVAILIFVLVTLAFFAPMAFEGKTIRQFILVLECFILE